MKDLNIIKKPRLWIKKDWFHLNLFIYVDCDQGCYLYSHDDVANWILKNENVANTTSWKEGECEYHWPYIPDNKKLTF